MKWGRIITAMVTPFDERGDLDAAEAARLAKWLVERGTDGLVVGGTTGEGPTLTFDERLGLVTAVKEAVGGHATVIANAGGNDTQISVAAVREMEGAGADGILSVVPYYNKPPQEGMLRHFGAIADATSLPIMIYNIPGRTGSNMQPKTLLELARRYSNVCAVKESSGDVAQFAAILRERREGFAFLCGDDHLFLPALALGADGVVGVATHLCSREFGRMADAVHEGRIADAARIHFDLMPLMNALFATTSPIPIKWAMNQMGFHCGECRLPLGPMPDELKPRLRELMEQFKIGTAV